ncbi:hypothetical protein E4L95_22365 [Paracoccus liaowanqingii]|uniref:Uncharacterized protein n=1 Tax=Paracoccus liaowanqingii TaxID=2560053 RepID=A0A4Z1BLD6_9RHOB|nr:hypothetical protein [Paracoccus liaowanqingii]QDA36012.1 hypothetical protein E4191_17885 [Paracoccus liaowanqingii]TGN37678.1 hypothetical protein E4L95_22365 [Paracoccus liaowanqingii]
MTTVYFSGGKTAEVEDVRGENPRTFNIPVSSYSAFAEAMIAKQTLKFSEHGETYLFKQMHVNQGTAILQVSRR